jgi:hypothetical protein
MKNQDNMTLPKVHNSYVAESKDIKINEMLDKELKRITSEKINTCKKYRKTTE